MQPQLPKHITHCCQTLTVIEGRTGGPIIRGALSIADSVSETKQTPHETRYAESPWRRCVKMFQRNGDDVISLSLKRVNCLTKKSILPGREES